MPKHDFGIIDEISDALYLYVSYEPAKYHCISIDDDYIESLLTDFNKVNTYFNNTSTPREGLAYCGITLIPPESLHAVKSIFVLQDNQVYDDLIALIDKAIQKNKYIIHYGI